MRCGSGNALARRLCKLHPADVHHHPLRGHHDCAGSTKRTLTDRRCKLCMFAFGSSFIAALIDVRSQLAACNCSRQAMCITALLIAYITALLIAYITALLIAYITALLIAYVHHSTVNSVHHSAVNSVHHSAVNSVRTSQRCWSYQSLLTVLSLLLPPSAFCCTRQHPQHTAAHVLLRPLHLTLCCATAPSAHCCTRPHTCTIQSTLLEC